MKSLNNITIEESLAEMEEDRQDFEDELAYWGMRFSQCDLCCGCDDFE